ncbi:hypothetical protein VE03_10402 [Pseudogymnoascus sp. 23342-1-I1]|nr:hypothetical protein VE03_10402 [Pseudogymnoascus sp. 23342-1-I1]
MSHHPSYIVVRGPQDVGNSEEVKKGNQIEVAKREAFQTTITKAAAELGVFISEKHQLRIRDITIPSDNTLQMVPPENLKGEKMVLGIWYLTNRKFEIDKKVVEGPATIILRRDGRDGVAFSGVTITVDDTADRGVATSLIAFEN